MQRLVPALLPACASASASEDQRRGGSDQRVRRGAGRGRGCGWVTRSTGRPRLGRGPAAGREAASPPPPSLPRGGPAGRPPPPPPGQRRGDGGGKPTGAGQGAASPAARTGRGWTRRSGQRRARYGRGGRGAESHAQTPGDARTSPPPPPPPQRRAWPGAARQGTQRHGHPGGMFGQGATVVVDPGVPAGYPPPPPPPGGEAPALCSAQRSDPATCPAAPSHTPRTTRSRRLPRTGWAGAGCSHSPAAAGWPGSSKCAGGWRRATRHRPSAVGWPR